MSARRCAPPLVPRMRLADQVAPLQQREAAVAGGLRREIRRLPSAGRCFHALAFHEELAGVGEDVAERRRIERLIARRRGALVDERDAERLGDEYVHPIGCMHITYWLHAHYLVVACTPGSEMRTSTSGYEWQATRYGLRVAGDR